MQKLKTSVNQSLFTVTKPTTRTLLISWKSSVVVPAVLLAMQEYKPPSEGNTFSRISSDPSTFICPHMFVQKGKTMRDRKKSLR